MAAGFPVKENYANGDVLTATNLNDLAGTVNLLTSSTLSSSAGKNAVINGGMDIWQRGTSFSLAASAGSTYLADRWQTYTSANQASTFSRQTTSDTTNLPNIQYCLRFQRNSGQTGTSLYNLGYSFENLNSIPLAGKAVTLSFYARKGANYSAASSALQAVVVTGTGTDQNVISGFTGAVYPISQTATLTTTWQRFTYTGTIAATATQIGFLFQFTPVGTASTNDYYEITGVQLELGSTATTFSRTGGTMQGELAACQRYYAKVTSSGGNTYAMLGNGIGQNATTARVNVKYPQSLRTVPSSLDYSTIALHDGVITPAITVAVLGSALSGTEYGGIDVNIASGGVAYRPYFLLTNGSATAYVGFNAEL